MSSHSTSPNECIETVTDSKPKVEDNGRKAVFLNPGRNEIKKVRIDGCLIAGIGPRADFVVAKPSILDVIVELKGRDIYHARDQIIATLTFWRRFPPFSSKIAGLIVCTKSPMSASELQVMKARVLLQHKLWLEIDENGRKEYSFLNFGPD